ncbi:MAG: hypothetical protein Q9227_002743 [Pyrenula ochraceoflavens]
MSFFGFNTTLPQEKPQSSSSRGIFEHNDPFADVSRAHKLQTLQGKEEQTIDFEDTYDGLGDNLEETNDDFNDDTFGGASAEDSAPQAVGKDFDFFGRTAQVSNVLDEENLRFNLNRPAQQPPSTAPSKAKKTGYEKYQDPGYIPEIQAKSSVWGTKPQTTAINQPPTSTAPASKKMMSLEEVEAAMRAQSQPNVTAHPSSNIPPYTAGLNQGGYLSQSEKPLGPPPGIPPEAVRHPQASNKPQAATKPPLSDRSRPAQETRPQAQSAGHAPVQSQVNGSQIASAQQTSTESSTLSQNIPIITHPSQLYQLSEEQRKIYMEEDAKRAKRNHKIFLLSKGNGLMSPQDKNFITRIQLQQLVAVTGNAHDPDPEAVLAEDFYYQVYSQIRGAPRQHPTQPLGHFAQTYLFQTGGRLGGGGGRRHYVNGDNHMQRMQQQVQRAVEAAKQKPKNKQLIVEGSLGKIAFSNAKTPRPLLNLKRSEQLETSKKVTVTATDRKSILKNIENVYQSLMRLEDLERQMPPSATEGGDSETLAEWQQSMKALNTKLWGDLKVLEPIVPGSTTPHPFIAFLSFSKGKKAIPRIFRHIDQEQRVTILTMIVVHLDQLDVISRAQLPLGETQPPLAVREEIELFLQLVMPSLLGYVTEAPINIIIGLMGLVLDQSNVMAVARTRVGLGILTMLLSRAELVKESGNLEDQDWQQWSELYNRLFDILEPILSHIFPGQVNTGDDMYVWQFLAGLGIGATPEQQQRLVIAVKDRVMETVTQSKTLPPDMAAQRLGNVNLFMRAIGLDVELLG